MFDARLPIVFSRRQARLLGFTDHAIRWRVRRGDWHHLRPGVFCLTDVFSVATPDQEHLLASLAVCVSVGAGEVVSHLSAALHYGWPSPLDVSRTPWTTAPAGVGAQTRRRDGRVRQVAPLPAPHVIGRRGIRLTSPARTVADCLRHLPPEESVPIADAAIAAGVDSTEIAKVLVGQADWPYAGRGLASGRLVDSRRESWLESRTAVAFHQLGVPMPEPQVEILDERGRFVARSDFAWVAAGVLGEADGWGKYDLDPAGGRSALRDEKEREDRLRDLGWEVVRWTAADILGTRPAVVRRLERAFARTRPERLRGAHRPSRPSPAPERVEAEGLRRLELLAPDRALVLPGDARWSLHGGDRAS